MMKSILVWSVLLIQTQAFALNNAIEYYFQKQMQLSEYEAQKRLKPKSLMSNAKASEQEAKYKQKIDHKNPNDFRTFDQRYFINTQFSSGKKAPVIYVICGEGTCDGASTMTAINAVAQKMGASLVALEHRYYGHSQPFPLLTSDNLKYLSTEQALEDLAEFQKFAQSNLGLNGKWIAVGGSYPGNLSAFYRLKHPELISGALASSAPVLAKANFWEYDRHVGRVAGPTCLSAINSAVAEVEDKLKTSAGSIEMRKLFRAEVVRSDVDFLYILADMAATAIQYGYQTQFCTALADGMTNGTAVKAYAEVGLKLFDAFGITPLQDSFQGAESLDPKDYLGFAGMRSWMYQSCTEYGYYQTANTTGSETSRSAQLTLAYHHDVCKRLFGITVPVDDAKTNQNYFSQLFDQAVTNIFFTNGSNDPWSNLSITPSTANVGSNPGLSVVTIAGASHCDDLGSRASSALSQARSQFMAFAQSWVKKSGKSMRQSKGQSAIE